MKNNDIRFSDKYLQLSEIGYKFRLSFSSYLELGNKTIALDGKKKRLLVSEIGVDYRRIYIIELDKVKSISVKKSYNNIKPGELNKRKFEEFLNAIHLQFEYENEAETIALSFYENEIDSIRDLPRLERNARNWQMILSNMIGSQISQVAKERRQLLLTD